MKTFHEYVQAAIKFADGMGYEGDNRKRCIYDFVDACFIGGLSK